MLHSMLWQKVKIRDFFRTIDVASLDTYYDPDFKLVKQFKMRGLPTSILIDKNGKHFSLTYQFTSFP